MRIQSDGTDPIPGETLLLSVLRGCSGLIKCLKLGNKGQECVADFPRSVVMLVLFCSDSSGVIWKRGGIVKPAEIYATENSPGKPAEGHSSYSAGSEQEKGQPTFDVEK